jgi:hypothetical protein
MPVLDDAIAKAEALLQELKDASAQLAADEQGESAAAPATLEVVPPSAAADPEPPLDGAAPDNALPFKCPACGATYEAEVECVNGHQAEQTLPTADVLAGATIAEEAPAATPEPSNAVTETGTTTPPPAAADPPWPGATE